MGQDQPVKWSEILGRPGEGFHAARLAGFARNDVVGTLVLGIVIGKLAGVNVAFMTVSLFVLGAWLHWAFGVQTTLNRMLFTRTG